MRTVRVVACAREAQDVLSLVLEPVDGGPLEPFAAGAHIDVEIVPGLVRQYSLCPPLDDPACHRIAIHRDAAGRGGSMQAHATLRQGTTLRIGAPRNLFPLAAGAPPSVLFAGGIGITPILAMVGELRRRGAPVTLHDSVRSVGHAAFLGELRAALGERLHVHASEGEGRGRLDIAAALAAAPRDAHLYVCGPARYGEAVVAGALARGWCEHTIHRESFTPVAAPPAGDRAFVVRTARSGRRLAVRPDQTLLAALLDAGLDVPTSCEQGICGTCLTGVLDGVPDHRDLYLTADERAANRHLLPCCSRALSPELVLDL